MTGTVLLAAHLQYSDLVLFRALREIIQGTYNTAYYLGRK